MTSDFGLSNHLKVNAFLEEWVGLSKAQQERTNVIEDPYVKDVFAVRVPPYRNEATRYFIVYLNKDPQDFEEVEWDTWPPPMRREGDLSWLI